MTDKFDPATHRFGMAYRTDYGAFCYVSRCDDYYSYCVHQGQESLFVSANDDLTRAPEHDLIPRADADKLLEALRECAKSRSMYGLTASKAITEYEQKHGERK